MKKGIISTVLILFFAVCSFGTQARNIELVDVPTANSMLKAELRYDVKFYAGGGVLNRIYVGVFDRLMIGAALNVTNLVGNGQIQVVLPPKLLGKFRITDDEGGVPAIAIGYEGESYLDMYTRGVFISVTKEIALGSAFMQLTGTVYTSQFSDIIMSMDMGAGAAFAITQDFMISAEVDSLFRDSSLNLNCGISYRFEPITIEVILKYGLGEDDVRHSRVLRLTYISYF
ncbi:MAG: hypothetical protein CVV21_03475 [Candidatus Goldiibacteriota bacterium HGW-Goldbacteria-1]|jgi:hypothetical protein|nr:MAG: hypothetical protein CVV21_03475 [Candidatus Goldiibacteriota bacterium HGW-Goldbacteria-1]